MKSSVLLRRRALCISLVIALLSVFCLTAFANDTENVAFVVPDIRTRAGKTVSVAVQVPENSGMVSAMLKVSYDKTKLRLTGAENGVLFSADTFTSGSDLTKIPYTVLWAASTTHENITTTGTIVTFSFEVLEDAAAGVVPITVNVSSVYDVDLNEIPFDVTDGSIEIMDCVPGDAGGDGVVDTKDVIELTRYLADGWDAEIDTFAADVDADGVLTLKDVILLRRFLAGWDVELQ